MNKFLSNEELLFYLPEFIEIYKKRPIKNNLGAWVLIIPLVYMRF